MAKNTKDASKHKEEHNLKTVSKKASKTHSQTQSAKTGKFVTTENYISKPRTGSQKPPEEKK
jgi:hypothetical protein